MTTLIGILGLVLCGAAVAALAWGFAHPRTRALARMRNIEAYGFEPEAASAALGSEPRHSPFLALGARIGGMLDHGFLQDYENWVRRRLIAAAMYDVAARTVVGLQFLTATVVGLLFAVTTPASGVFGNIFLTLAAAGIFWAAPAVYVHGRAARRLDQIERQVPDLIDMLVVTLEAGLAFGASLATASTRMQAPIGDEIKLTMQEQNMGLSTSEALTNTLARADTPNMSAFVRSVVQGTALGVSMGVVMRNLAADMRVRRRQQAEERAHKAPVKMLFPLIFLMFPALGVVILGPAMFEITEKLGSNL
jgi:tight adherence protein C